jgi:hypothetical protein
MLLFAPLGLLGIFALIAVLFATFIAPLYALTEFITGGYAWGAVISVFWIIWLRFGKRARRFVFEGFEHGRL